MNIAYAVNSATQVLAVVAALIFVYSHTRRVASAHVVASAILVAAAFTLAGSLAQPAWLPAGAFLTNADGSPRDPRLTSVMTLGVAALAALLPVLAGAGDVRARLGTWIPALVVASIVGAGGYVIGLRLPVALTGLALGGFVAGAAIAASFGPRGRQAFLGLSVLALGAGLLVAGATASLHGAGATRVNVAEGMHADTLGAHLTYLRTEAPNDSLRRIRLALGTGGRVDSLWLELRGSANGSQRGTGAGRLLSGPVVVSTGLEERRANPHGVTWMRKGETVESGDARITFDKFRFEMGEPIRLFADLRVEVGGKTLEAHPGTTAHSKGEKPFIDEVPGYGPITVAGVDADNGRVGLILPKATGSSTQRIVTLAVRLRPGLELALAGLAVMFAGLLLSLSRRRTA